MAAQYITDVHDVASSIPRGRVTTYGSIASFLTLGSARMVGWAMNKCLPGEEVPAHRVLNRKGELSGRNAFSTPTLMQERLEAEGVSVTDNKVDNFAELFWNPTELLE
ncbi:MGMT family protein [Neolewinella antarctica]|uniref:Methylated-DNA-protein-cysteine methyltransferase-like protein n=1 Tax=Neolewinella antarctica TaxID=442734 RepID=A0ABX0XFW9_9BACT|nr:MGMT family protein [Neolewinella antarctica]NJC27799.1 methylated-DNA-protein-cysteine methyltransferase-like protein [Neolewinella antarctica]